MKSESFLPILRQQRNVDVQAPEHRKDIDKIVQPFNRNVMVQP